MCAVSVQHIQVNRELLASVDLIAAIDRGCSLIKLLFASKSDYEASKARSDSITLTLELHLTTDFEAAIDSMLRQMHIPDNADGAVLRVTGAGAEREMQLLREKTPFKVMFVDEFFCQVKGTHTLLQHFPHTDILHSPDELDELGLWKQDLYEKNGILDKIAESRLQDAGNIPSNSAEPTSTFPCVIGVLGSAAYFFLLKEDGSIELLGDLPWGGKCFLGLGRLLLNTKSYHEIFQLAEKGDRGNVDSQIKDFFSNTADSSYGQYDPDRPIWSFGKAADLDKNLDEFPREDVAVSLVDAFAGNVNALVAGYVALSKCSQVYLTGNLCAVNGMRNSIEAQRKLFGMTKLFSIRCLKTGHTGAIGALLANLEKDNLVL